MDAWKADSSFSTLAKISDFAERIGYDANGNILQYQRNGNHTFAGKPLGMDSLTYSYQSGTNKLDHINDAAKADNYTEDIDDQAAGNYSYDAIGNLVKDNAGGISTISWTVYGKIDNILKSDGSTIKYLYDAAGNRISKTVLKGGITTATGYVRDASGNVMSVYTAADTTNNGHLMQSEVDLYGSSRLGIWKPGIDVDYLTPATDTIVPLLGTGYSLTFARGNKLFELSNHLGNVLTTLSDKKLQHTSDSATVDFYKPDVVSAGDYYPFGMGMPGRSYTSGSNYRYGFNGKEKDPDLDGNNYDYGFRIYNPQIGRFLSTDPLYKEYPHLTPYQFASNTPIFAVDRDGQEFEPYWATTVPQKIHEYEAELYRKDPQHAAQIIFHHNVNAFLFVGGALTAGVGAAFFPTVGATAALTNITAGAVTTYTTYSVAAANVGAFVVELLNPDPNGTPGLEFSQGDEVARGLKLLFKQSAVPLIKPIEKFIINTTKLDYLFGKLEYQNLKGADLETYANNAGRTVESLIHNQERASSMARVFENWGIKDSKEGFGKLADFFSAGLNGKQISTMTNEFGTTVTREISLVFTAGEKKGQFAGSMRIGYFYKGGNMSVTPEITTVISKAAKTP